MPARLPGLFDAQRGGLFHWVPMCLAIGIGLYFALPAEPGLLAWQAVLALLVTGIAALAAGLWRWPTAVALVLIVAGLGLGGLRTASVAGPVLGFRYYGPVEGRVIEVDRSASDKPRLTLDRVVLERVSPDRTPRRVRVSLHGDQRWLDPAPGQVVIVTAHLSAPEGPVEPGGFDFQRSAWFEGLGAVGYARSPALLLEPSGRSLPVQRLRARIGGGLTRTLPGDVGAVAAAITTGDRSAIGAKTLADLRAANLAHLLAISGLHMGLLTGLVFGAVRLALAVFPSSVGWPVKSVAAVCALLAGAAYLLLSGGNVATQRAFVMAAVMLIAVIAGRRALSLRAVAMAALIVLALRPEALTGPGFQMSFAATVALVAVFRGLRDRGGGPRHPVLRWLMALVVSSAVAGAATAPVGAAHFNQLSQYGLIANLLSVPVMGALVMPAALAAALLWPVGLSGLALWAMGLGIEWILFVADRVSAMEGAVIPVATPPGAVLPLLAVGGLWLVLWRGLGRHVGWAPVLCAAWLWAGADRPDVLVAPSAALVGAMGSDGRALSKPRGAGFAARVWLENDGDLADQPAASKRPGWTDRDGARVVQVGGREVHHVFGRGGVERAAALCRPGAIVVSSQPIEGGTCLLFTPDTLSRTGAVALRFDDGKPVVTTARNVSGSRPWNSRTDRKIDRLAWSWRGSSD